MPSACRASSGSQIRPVASPTEIAFSAHDLVSAGRPRPAASAARDLS